MLTMLVVAAVAVGGWYLRECSYRRTRPMSGGLHPEIALPHDAEFELYHNAFSLCSKKIRMCLAELELPYRGHHIDLIETGRYETLSREFLAVNPAALVPVLVHDGHPVYESHDILQYAAAHAPTGRGLTPADEATRALMQRWIDKSSLVGDDPTNDLASSAGNCAAGMTVPLFAAMIRDIPTLRILEGLLFHRLKFRPVTFLLLKLVGLSRLGAVPPVRHVVTASRREMERHLDDLERQLAVCGGPWITGGQFTLADVSWAVIFERLREADWVAEVLTATRPLVSAYWARLQERPSYRAAMTECEHPMVHAGTRRIAAEKQANVAFRRALYAAA
jgi:ganglioside-induced differentiation-associated protein 1